MNTNYLIAISGIKGSGKDTVAHMLQYCLSVPKMFRQYWIYKKFGRYFKKCWKITAFASNLKKVLSIILHIPVKRFNNRSFKENYYIDLKTLDIYNVSNLPAKETLSDTIFAKKAKAFDPDIKEYLISIRQLMQLFGTEYCRRLFGPDVWVLSTLAGVTENTIVSDLRFVNEALEVKKRNGILIYIDRGLEFGQHPSEKEMKLLYDNCHYDYVIRNNASLKDLFNSVKELVNKL